MEHGFYHPAHGYWQTIDTPSAEIVSAYPEGTVEVPLKPGENFEWDGTGWVAVTQPLPERRASALAALKARRDQAMASGVTIGGVTVATDDLSQQRLTSAALAAQIDPNSVVNWKTADGFVTLGAAQITPLALAVRGHVQACFDREAVLLAEIEASDAPEAVDISTGWPEGGR